MDITKHTIKNEKDIAFFKNYFKDIETKHLPPPVKNDFFMPSYIRKFIGKTVKITLLIGNKTDIKMGTLTAVGTNYLCLNNNYVFEMGCVKAVNVINKKPL